MERKKFQVQEEITKNQYLRGRSAHMYVCGFKHQGIILEGEEGGNVGQL
jgi:hypothetical protein